MPNTYSQLHIHLIFTVSRRSCLIADTWRERLYLYMVGIIHRLGHHSLIINGVTDHVHLLLGMNPKQSVSTLVQQLKSASSTWINMNQLTPERFSSQSGYGAFSHSHSALPDVIRYIANQQEHHGNMTFLEEYERFLRKFEVEYDEKYLFKPVLPAGQDL